MGPYASVASSALWAVASVWFSRLSARWDPLAVNAGKNSVALVLFALTLAALEGRLVPAGLTTHNALWLAASATVGLALGDTAFFSTLRILGTRRAVTLTLLGPPMAAILGVLFLGEPITAGLALGMGLTLGGLWLVVDDPRADAGPAPSRPTLLRGVAWALAAALCQAGGAVLTRHGSAGLDALEVSVVRLFFAVVILGVMLAATRRLGSLTAMVADRPTLRLLLVATTVGTWGGIWLMNEGLLHAPVGVAATLNSLAPVFMLPVAAFWLREPVTLRAALGALVATSGAAVLLLG